MDRWQNCVAVVTGASSGIGKAIAKDLVTAGLRVVALGRRKQLIDENRSKLTEDEQSRYFALKCDITSEADIKTTFQWIEENLGGTDILVNNAGILLFGNLLQMSTAEIDQVLNTNVKGLIACTQEAFKSMKARNINGHIVHINSVAGHDVVAPQNGSFNIYPPSKFAVTAINETIRNELRNLGTQIKTTSISPGSVLTDIVPKEMFQGLGKVLDPEDISQAVMFAISTPPHVQIHEIIIKPVASK